MIGRNLSRACRLAERQLCHQSMKGDSSLPAPTRLFVHTAASDRFPPIQPSGGPSDDRAGRVPDMLFAGWSWDCGARPSGPGKPTRSCFVRPGFFSGAVKKMQRSPASLGSKLPDIKDLRGWDRNGQVTRFGEYRPGERPCGLLSRRGGPQPGSYNLWKQPEFLAVTGCGEIVRKGVWRRESVWERTFSATLLRTTPRLRARVCHRAMLLPAR